MMSPLSQSRRTAASLCSLALVAACTPGIINFVHVDSGYDPTTLAHIPFTGPLYAEVSGNPFGIPQEELQRLVNDAIQPSRAKSEKGQGVRVHFAFGATAADRNSACSIPGTNAVPATTIPASTIDHTIPVVAALCRSGRYGQALTYLVGSVDDVQGANDPRFAKFLRAATVQLFPRWDPNRDNNWCFLPGC